MTKYKHMSRKDYTKKDKEKQNPIEQSICLKVGGEIFMKAEKGTSLQQFVYNVLNELAEWRTDDHTNTIYVRFHERQLLQAGALADDTIYCKEDVSLDNDDVRKFIDWGCCDKSAPAPPT